MTAVVLAHHPIIAAVPVLVPALMITLIMVVIAVRDRRGERHEGRMRTEDQHSR